MRTRLIILVVLASIFAIGYMTGLYQHLAPEKLRDFQDYRMLVFGLALVAMMVLRPQGLIPAVREGRASPSPAGG